MTLRWITGKGVTAAKGFQASGVSAEIKASGARDLALIFSGRPASAAGTFTTNLAAAAPVQVSRERVAAGVARGVVVNSGCANAATGKRGYDDAVEMAALAAAAVGIPAEEMLVCSTGLIGSNLPMERVTAGIRQAAAGLSDEDASATEAIMTTDTRPKRAAVASDEGWSVGGIAKGAGMIAPRMATMLAFITTDAEVEPRSLRPTLSEVVDWTFNAITIDGDTSTNDTVICLANGASGVAPGFDEFPEALNTVCRSLAEQIVADGEGATKFVRVRVTGARTTDEARASARTVAESLLVKTALWGGDPNWGRVVAALGRSGTDFDPEKISISIGGFDLLVRGEPVTEEARVAARSAIKSYDEMAIVCDLASGGEWFEIMTTDLSPKYVELNAAYE
ncbi:MAG: bifunctional glutamate N-acetyltransferase/amino-acid acetyltransferase ArgJ, partial [Actinomycetota bacterium]